MWGLAFPIIGFRCGNLKNYWLEEYGGHYAIVKWRNMEPGAMYQVRLVGEDGSDTTIVTPDTVYVFNWLSDSVRYNVKLRKQCHYCTSNYDTTVYSGWTDPIYFGTTIPPTVWRTVSTSTNHVAWGIVYGGGVYADSSTVTLTAQPFYDFEFESWSDSSTANPRQIFVVSDTSFTAIFHEIVDTVGIIHPVIEGFMLQPNPARGTVQILLPIAAQGGRLSVCDIAGRELEVRTVASTTMEWDLKDLPTGTYLFKLETSQGTAIHKLIIKE